MKPIYLDNTSTTQIDPRVHAAMLPWQDSWFANPGSPHSQGRLAREAVEAARSQVASLVGCRDDEVVFTASATEANNLALKGVGRSRGRRSNRLVVSSVEHPSVLHPARTLASEGMALSLVPVDGQGHLDSEALHRLLVEGGCLVSVIHGHPEVGTLQDLAAASKMAHEAGALFHTDATLTAGILPGVWQEAAVDLLTLSPHLFHGPKGVAALAVRQGSRLRPQEEGGTQEGGLRSGTEPVPLVVGFGKAARLAREEASGRAQLLRRLQTDLHRRLEASLGDWVLTGDPFLRVPGHLSVCLRYVDGEAVVGLLDAAGILAASGSPCTREARKESYVLQALGIDPVLGRGSVQLSFGAFNQAEEVEQVVRVLPQVVEKLRSLSPLSPDAGRAAR